MGGRYRAYPKYKKSEVEWADLIPKDWGRSNLRWLCQMYAGGTPSKTVEEYWEDGTVPWLNSGAVNQKMVTEASTYITEDAYKNSSAKWIPKNALVMALAGQGKTKGMVAQLAIDTTCNQSMAAIVPNVIPDARYLYWWLTSNYQNIRNMAGGDLRDGLNLELLGNVQCPIPSLNEKDCIADFLGHETAKIDTLIEKQQQLIKLLKEKRQAVISHAVTKGLNPDAPMRDSGVEWLGEVPEHWRVTKLGQLAYMQEGPGLRTWQFKSSGTRVICVTNITEEGINFSKLEKFISDEEYLGGYQHFTVNEGDLLLSSSGNSWGKVAKYMESEKVILNTSTIRLNELQHKPLFLDYIQNFLLSEACREQLGVAMTGSCQPNFGPTHLKEVRTPIPPIGEQVAITEYISKKVTSYDRPLEACEKAVVLMQERRTALISAAVSGKIDVRGFNKDKEVS